MIFSPFLFLLFVLGVMFVYYFLLPNIRDVWLLLCSYAFCFLYGTNAVVVLIITTLFSYCMGILLERANGNEGHNRIRKIILLLGIVGGIAPLFLSKTGYSLFAVVGMAYYSLQQVGYLADIYRGKVSVEKNLIKYALYIAFFPKLVSGPIESSDSFFKQIDCSGNIEFDYERTKSGFLLMLGGYLQKCLISDTLSGYVASVYGEWEAYSGAMIILATIAFAFQLYADFAGYTNIVLGAAQVLGFRLKENFIQPYMAVSVKDFWRRWHVSLSTWLRDYVYISLGGNRKGQTRKCINLLITFAVSGLWHGISLGYLAWGLLHGVYLIFEELVNLRKIHPILQRIWTFILVDIAWVFFRASSFTAAVKMIWSCVFHFSAGTFMTDISSLKLDLFDILFGLGCIGLLIVTDIIREQKLSVVALLNKQPIFVRWSFYLIILFVLTIVRIRQSGVPATNFIYSQF